MFVCGVVRRSLHIRTLSDVETKIRFLNMSQDQEAKLVELVKDFVYDPLGFVRVFFDWGRGVLTGEPGPEKWQAEFLKDVGGHLRGGTKAPLYCAVASGHDVGKTALVAWMILWFLSTRPHPQVVVTANTKTQLETKTWRELAKWHNLALNRHWFEWTASKFYLKAHPETWFASAIPWTKERSEAFAGTHEKYVMMIFDEASAIDDEIWRVASGAMLEPGAIWLAFGNPTRSVGRFRECFPGGKFAHRWKHRVIDSREVGRSNKEEIEKWIQDYGEDSDFVRVRVKGLFPRASSTQFIPEDLVDSAMMATPIMGMFNHSPVVMGVDVARYGDDRSIILVRQGGEIKKIRKIHGIDTMQLVGFVIEEINYFNPAAVFVDAVGMGAGVVDRLRQLGYDVIEVNGAEKALHEDLYHNLRAEMWDSMRTWLKTAYLPKDDDLKADLIGVEYGFDAKNRIQLEKKEDMKKRGLASPDIADALALTFAFPVGIAAHKKAQDWRNLYEAFGPPTAASA